MTEENKEAVMRVLSSSHNRKAAHYKPAVDKPHETEKWFFPVEGHDGYWCDRHGDDVAPPMGLGYPTCRKQKRPSVKVSYASSRDLDETD
jgi:hypothetical protein